MKKTSGRRTFLKKISAGGVGATILPSAVLAHETKTDAPSSGDKTITKKRTHAREYNSAYENEFLKRVAFPVGGLGAGMFCLEGTGAISHMSVRNKPDVFQKNVYLSTQTFKIELYY